MLKKEDILEAKVEEQKVRIKKLINENIALVTDNMRLEYENKNLRKRVEILELLGAGYSRVGLSEGKRKYALVVIGGEGERYVN